MLTCYSQYYTLESTQMSSLIQHQQSLQKLKIIEGLGFSIIINKALPSVKNSLTNLILKYVDFEGCDPWYGVCTLHMLEVFKCKNCKGLTVEMIKPLRRIRGRAELLHPATCDPMGHISNQPANGDKEPKDASTHGRESGPQ